MIRINKYERILIDKAEQIATQSHNGQTRWDPKIPYITHPKSVADRAFSVSKLDYRYVCVAWLHDVVEDTSVTLDDLNNDFPQDIVDAVDAITKNEHMSYVHYIAGVANNDIARVIKIYDIEHNTSNGDNSKMTKNKLKSYQLALLYLRHIDAQTEYKYK